MIEHLSMTNGSMIPLPAVPRLPHEDFRILLRDLIEHGNRIAGFFALPVPKEEQFSLVAVLADDHNHHLDVLATVPATRFESLISDIPQLHLFERETAEQFGLVFKGHPWFKPVRFHSSRTGKDAWNRPTDGHPLIGDMDYFQIEGEEIHEVGVGPVHAGVIEPGHFRFQCHGERVLHLEISLGYQHRGIERMLIGGPWPRTPLQMETIAGDTTIGHMTAHSRVMEALSGCSISPRAAVIRAIALELERLANHVGDIGALAGDVGYLPTASYCGRLRGDYLNMTAQICGSRFGRGLIRSGGVLFDIEPALSQSLLQTLESVTPQTMGALELFFNTPSVLARLETTGKVSYQDGVALGLRGVAGRSCGIDCDVRRHHDVKVYAPDEIPSILEENGDVSARALVRNREVIHSTDLLRRLLTRIPEGECRSTIGPLQPDSMAVCMVEGWRGAVTHIGVTDDEGRFMCYKAIDPSFFNWSGLALALRNEQISDFPLCNKSFNLSYCGFDL